MIFGGNIIFWVAYFIIYSLLGWILEVLHAYKKRKEWVNRGFIKGPFCPVYGFGALLILVILAPIQHNWIILFFGGVLLITLLEFVTGLLLETIFGAKWWDYQDEKYHIKGYVCPKYSFLFGVVAVITMKGIHPFIENSLRALSTNVLQVLVIIFITYLTVDFIQTVLEIMGLNRLLRDLQDKIDELQQLEIRETLLNERIERLGKMEKHVEEIESRIGMIKEHFKELKIEYEAMLRAGMGRYGRIIRAFPKFHSKRFQIGYKKLKERFRSFRSGQQR